MKIPGIPVLSTRAECERRINACREAQREADEQHDSEGVEAAQLVIDARLDEWPTCR